MSPKPTSSRNRILVACTTCQSRRVKCARSPGESRCEQCRRSNLDCVIRPDGRRRPISRAEVDSLRSRLQSLESLLRSQDVAKPSSSASNVPPYPLNDQARVTPLSTDSPSSNDQSGTVPSNTATLSHTLSNPSGRAPSIDVSSQDVHSARPFVTIESHVNIPDTPHGDYRQHSNLAPDLDMGFIVSHNNSNSPLRHEESSSSSPESPLAEIMSDGPSKVLIDRLTSSKHSIQYDHSSGRLRLSDPTIAFHQLSEMSQSNTTSSREQNRRVEKVLRELSPETHDHLLECFWSYYDPVMQVVDREVFEEDRRAGEGLTYSGFLHICILAMGYRYSDTMRPDIQKLALENKESTLHREAKYLVEFEFEKPGGIPSVQALLILGQLESGSGRDSVGWTYAGMAFRSAIDIGLNLDCSTLNLTKKEREFRSYVLRACTAFDRLWAIYLGRSTCMKSSDISRHAFFDPSQQSNKSYSQSNTNSEKSIEMLCFDTLLELLDLSAKVIELLYSRPGPLQHSDHFVIAGLDNDLKAWYSHLPAPLVWTKSNIDTAPLPYFHLHSQYHASLVLLHRPFALYEHSKVDSDTNGDALMNGLSSVSRAICIEHTFKMVQILTQQFQRFDPTRFPQAQLQHIGTAVSALISATAVNKDVQERMKLLKSLHVLADLARAISPTYAPAEMISDVLDNLLKEPGWGWKQTASTEREPSKDFSHNISTENDNLFNGTSPSTNRVQESISSLPRLSDGFDFTFETDDTMEIASGFGESHLLSRNLGALASVSTGLSPPPSQQTDAHKELAQMSYAPLASWTNAALDTNYGPGDLYDSGQYNTTDVHFDSML